MDVLKEYRDRAAELAIDRNDYAKARIIFEFTSLRMQDRGPLGPSGR